MFILHESIWWLLATGLIGAYLGYLKGQARWGLLLGLLLGPIGWAVTLFIPARSRSGGFRGPNAAHSAGPGPRAAGGCPRCGKPVDPGDKACGHCGNVLMPIRYRVISPSGP